MASNQSLHPRRKSTSTTNNTSTTSLSGPTGDEWARRLAEVHLDKSHLNRLVLDFLIVEGYQAAAEEFVRESGVLDDDGQPGAHGEDETMEDGEHGTSPRRRLDLEGIQERMAIRKAIESGRVEEAIRRVNELDPEILDLHPQLIFHLHLLHLYELLLASSNSPSSAVNSSNNFSAAPSLSSTLLFASETLAPLALSSPAHLAELEDALSLLLVLPNGADSNASEGNQERRVKVAKELNAAILEGQGRGCESKLVGVWRCLKWGEGELQRAS